MKFTTHRHRCTLPESDYRGYIPTSFPKTFSTVRLSPLVMFGYTPSPTSRPPFLADAVEVLPPFGADRLPSFAAQLHKRLWKAVQYYSPPLLRHGSFSITYQTILPYCKDRLNDFHASNGMKTMAKSEDIVVLTLCSFSCRILLFTLSAS